MTKKKQEQPETKTIDEQTSVAGIVFKPDGSVEFNILTLNVSLQQIMLAGAILTALANRKISDEWTKEMRENAKPKLVNLRDEMAKGLKM